MALWVGRLPRPIGLMACYDFKAQQLLVVCRELDIAVPEEVAVVGVDNDRLLCDLANPPLSSVIPNTHRTGYEAARILDRLMAGENMPPESHLIEPLGIQTRQSSDTLAIDDPDVAIAVRFIREHAIEGIDVSDVLARVSLSRRALESRFRRIINRTPHQEIMRVRIERVKMLLLASDFSLAEIAAITGFEHVEYLSVAFKREAGQTPRQYRKTVNTGGG
jgi:LacI family transcriptional regulator